MSAYGNNNIYQNAKSLETKISYEKAYDSFKFIEMILYLSESCFKTIVVCLDEARNMLIMQSETSSNSNTNNSNNNKEKV